MAWVAPHANQSFREELVGRFPERGINELTLTELRNSPREAFLFHVRLAVAVAPLTFATFGVVIATRRWRRSIAVAVACTAVVGFVVALNLGSSWSEQGVLHAARGGVVAAAPLRLRNHPDRLVGSWTPHRRHPNTRVSRSKASIAIRMTDVSSSTALAITTASTAARTRGRCR